MPRFPSALLPPRRMSRARRQRVRAWTGLGLALVGALALLLLVRQRGQREIRLLVKEAAIEAGLDPLLVEAVMRAESSGNPRAVSRAQAYGLMQLRLPTAEEMAGRRLDPEDLFDPSLNLELGCRYLRRLLDRYKDLRLALMAYNAGPGNLDRWRRLTPDPGEILGQHAFAETRAYVAKVLATHAVLVTDPPG